MRYLRFNSVTWWTGAASVLLGLLMAFAPSPELLIFGEVIAQLTGEGEATPATLIVIGLGLIGIRDKLERG